MKNNKLYFIIFLLLSLLPIYWIPSDRVIAMGDPGFTTYFYHPEYLLKIFSSTWFGQVNTGFSSTNWMSFLPFDYIFYLLYKIGFNGHYREVIIVCITILVSLWFMYLFIIEFFQDENKNEIAAFFGAIFYFFNIYFFNIAGQYLGEIIFYGIAYIPMLFLFSLKGVKTLQYKYMFYVLLVTILYSFMLGFPQYLISVLLILLIILINEIFSDDKRKIKSRLSYLSIGIFTLFLSNFFWILPFFASMLHLYKIHLKGVGGMKSIFSATKVYSDNLISAFQGLANNAKTTRYLHESYYLKVIPTLAGLIIFIAIITSFFNFKGSRRRLLIALLFFIALFFYIGDNYPFSYVKLFMLERIPFFGMFSNFKVAAVFPLIILLSILFGCSIALIYGYIADFLKNSLLAKFFVIFTLLMFFIYNFPIFNGYLINSSVVLIPSLGTNRKFSPAIQIPDYYVKISKYFNKEPLKYRTMTLPFVGDYVAYKWKYGYEGGDFIYLLYMHNSINYYQFFSHRSSYILRTLSDSKFIGISNIAGLFSVKYIIIQHDVFKPGKNHIDSKYNNELRPILEDNGIKFRKKFGKLDLYKVPNKYYLNFIYTPVNLIFVNNYETYSKHKINYKIAGMVPDIAMLPDFKVRSGTFFSELNTRKNNFEINSILKTLKYKSEKEMINGKIRKIKTYSLPKPPTIEFKRINPTKYIVIVHNVKTNFPLIFNQAYSDYWKLYIEKYPNSYYSKHLSYQCNDKSYKGCMSINRVEHNIDKGNISFIGNKFISKNFNGTIQNDNIPSGGIFQTLFQTGYTPKYHFIVNGYANSWWININSVKKLGPQYYKVNKNGTYDFEFIIDYWPQRLFYIGIIISATTVVVFGLYLIYDVVRKRKTK